MISVSPRFIQNVVVIVVVIILGLSSRFGWKAGRDIAQTSGTVRSVNTLLVGLHYFYEDQARFPSSLEFRDSKRMATYFNYFPAKFFTDSRCPENGVYSTSNQKIFSLQFCIVRSQPPFGLGLNTVTERTLVQQ